MAEALETDTFEHFRILRREDGTLWELGRGAMGVTFKAVDTRLDSLVALKVIGARATLNSSAHARFRREARAAASLRHPNIASVHHFGEERDVYFYAMEFVEGESVGKAVRAHGPFPWPIAADIARQTASALAAVHAGHLVHRDIKPDNLMLTRAAGGEANSCHVKLIDFGLARSLAMEGNASQGVPTVGFLGTPLYASPEQCEELECDIRSDIYSLGATLWFMLAGQPLFAGNLFQVFDQHVTKPPPFGALPPDVPPELRHLLTRMLAKAPTERPQTPVELRRELEACCRMANPPLAVAFETMADPVASHSVPTAHPIGATAGSPISPSQNLPVLLTHFFGREQEIAALQECLRDGHRLVTLTGHGGTGKTRLALEVARQAAAALGRRTHFVPLADLTDARFVPRRLRDSLLPAAVGEGADAFDVDALMAEIVIALSSRPCLLVLDNFEQLVEDGAEFVRSLLTRVDSLSCLVTSRRRLDLSGEREFILLPLSVPPGAGSSVASEQVRKFTSVQLFCDRARAVRAGFALSDQNAAVVAELCRRVEGIPLAIELAAARVDVLTPQQIVARLAESSSVLVGGKQDVAARHRTLRATLDWSHELLSPELRLLFARLSVFRGGWTAEAAAAMLEEKADLDESLMRLGELRRCSLIVTDERGETMRYRMLEMVRQYAGEQLAALGDEEAVAARRRHRDFFLALALRAEPELRKSDQANWLDLLETEHGNFRAALARTNDGEAAQLSLAYCLHRFWMIHNHITEGREWLGRALTGDENGGSGAADPLLAKGWNAAGVLAWAAGDLDTAQTHLARSLVFFEAMENLAGTASALNNLGLVACEQSNFAEARARFEKSIALYRQLETPGLLAAVLNNLSRVFIKEQMYADARKCLEESMALHAAADDHFNHANILASLGEVEALKGNFHVAYQRFAECLTIRSGLGDTNNFEVYWRIASVAVARGDLPEAVRLLGAADAARQTRSFRLAPVTSEKFRADLALAASGMDSEDFARLTAEGNVMSSNEIAQLCSAKSG